MKDLIKLRKKSVTKTMLIVLIVFLGSLTFFADQIGAVANTIIYNDAPMASSIEQFHENITKHNASKISVDYLVDSGVFYGTENEEDTILTYTLFDDYLIVIAQDGNINQARLFDSEEPETITIYKYEGRKYEAGEDMIIKNFAEYYEMDVSDVENYFYPDVVVLDEIRSNVTFLLVYFIGGIVLLIGLYIFLYNKATKDLLKAFDGHEMDVIDEQINKPIYQDKHNYITKDYIIKKSDIRLSKQVFNVHDVVWSYYTETQHRTYGVPTGKTYIINLYFKGNKNQQVLTITLQNLSPFFDALRTANPEVRIGYIEEYVNAWKQTKNGDHFLEITSLPQPPKDAFKES